MKEVKSTTFCEPLITSTIAATISTSKDDNRQEPSNNGNDSATQPNNPLHRSYTLYLIRHGEAVHNVQEKLAEQQAQQESLAQGLPESEVKHRMQVARERVLDDPAYFDSPLTELGIQQAQDASDQLYNTAASSPLHAFPLPSEVFCSPLQRTLQTAAHMFVAEQSYSIRVREELRERLTGRPADNRYSSSALASRKSFARFSFKNLRRHSMLIDNDSDDGIGSENIDNDEVDIDKNSCDDYMLSAVQDLGNVDLDTMTTMDDDDDEQSGQPPRIEVGDEADFCIGLDLDASSGDNSRSSSNSSCRGRLRVDWQHRDTDSNVSSTLSSSRNVETCMELDEDLQVRAAKLLGILCGSESSSVAVVSHKAYLRALERGVFGKTDAPEFGNCEIRVYNIVLDNSSKGLVKAERML